MCLAALPLLVGSKCAFFFSSGDGSSDREDDDKEDDTTIIVATGSFGDPPVEGISYESGSLEGVTDKSGTFRYEDGDTVRFFIGNINLGSTVQAKSVMTPQDLVVESASSKPEAVNISRLLWSLDSNPEDEIITIPQSVRAAAIRSNENVSSAIEYLDFSDESAFVNAASQLVAVLTQDYPFTATLVDSDFPRERETGSIAKDPQ